MNTGLDKLRYLPVQVNNKSTRKRCEISPKLIKNLPNKDGLQDLYDSDIHSSCEESDFSGSDAEL